MVVHHLSPTGVAGFVLANGSMSFNQSGEGEIRKNLIEAEVDRTHRELTDAEISRIAGTYHAWRREKEAGEYADIPGFCKAASLEEIRRHGHVLTPGRYVGAEAQEEDDEPFQEKMQRLAATLEQQFPESARLEKAIRENLKALGITSQHV